MLACQNRLRGGVLERYSKYEVEDHVGRTNGIWGMMEMEICRSSFSTINKLDRDI